MQREENKGRRVVVYPAYLEARLSRGRGRRVPRELAVRGVSAREILEAARELGLEAWVEPGRHPRAWWMHGERVVVEKRYSKTRLLRMLAETILRLRTQKRK